jgi:drug/metabolite transporter (DMT)-like permease
VSLRGDLKLWAAGAAAVVFAASGFTGVSVGLEAYSPGHLALLRFLGASSALVFYAVIAGVPPPRARDLPAIALMGFLAFSAYTVLLGYGQLSVPAGTASLLIATIPAFTALWVVAFLGERMGGWGWLGVAISIVGIALISFGEGRGFGVEPGALLVLLAALSTSAYFALQKPYLKRYGSFELTAYAVWAVRSSSCPSRAGSFGRLCGRRPALRWPPSTSACSRPSRLTGASPTPSRGSLPRGRSPWSR